MFSIFFKIQIYFVVILQTTYSYSMKLVCKEEWKQCF